MREDDLSSVYEANSFGVFDLPWKRHRYLSLYRRARRFLEGHRPLGVVCYALGPHVALAWACKTLGIPFILHIGNAPPASVSARRKITIQMRLGDRGVAAYAPCSGYVRDTAVTAYGLSVDRVRTILNGLRLDDYSALHAERPRSPRGEWMIAMVGSLEMHKDQAVLIDALAELRIRGENVHLRLAGKGSKEKELLALARTRRVGHSITWGPVDDAREVLADADVFAYSVTPDEGMGIALAEALAAGVPTVASDVGACREVLHGGHLGTLVPSRNPTVWADELTAARGRAPVPVEELERFDINRCLAGYLDLLRATA